VGNTRRILVIAAHPDDEVLGCGGLIAKQSQQQKIDSLILGRGIAARYQNREAAPVAEIETLKAKVREVADLLGIDQVFHFHLPDNRFDTVALLDIIKKIEGVLDQVQPEVIYTHYYGDLNIDHQLTFRAVLTATRPLAGQSVKELYTFEIPSSTEWSFQRLGGTFCPNVFVDVSHTLDLKIQALRIYNTEIRQFPHPRSPEALQAIAARWGSAVGLQYAEAFELVRSIR
jgi:LmbE family N-acetylglucosaminyl deacetylase